MYHSKAHSAENGMPFSRGVMQLWCIRGAPFGRAEKPSSALLYSLELTTASPAVARLAANDFSTRCIRQYDVDGALVPNRINNRFRLVDE
jgi:hypothetical protein